MYSPVHEGLTGQVIAVVEIHEKGGLLEQVLFRAKLESWLLIVFVTMSMSILLFVIVHRGSRTIENQETTLKKRILELSDLRNRQNNVSRRSADLNERFLRRLGSDLHDGPAQLVGLALLRLDAIRRLVVVETQISSSKIEDLEIVQSALDRALTEIRNISAGLVPPELDVLDYTLDS
jgi:signal transduction histidine kinase